MRFRSNPLMYSSKVKIDTYKLMPAKKRVRRPVFDEEEKASPAKRSKAKSKAKPKAKPKTKKAKAKPKRAKPSLKKTAGTKRPARAATKASKLDWDEEDLAQTRRDMDTFDFAHFISVTSQIDWSHSTQPRRHEMTTTGKYDPKVIKAMWDSHKHADDAGKDISTDDEEDEDEEFATYDSEDEKFIV